ncbi:hypothetical protein ACSJAO_005341, partial [Escherichia coli]
PDRLVFPVILLILAFIFIFIFIFIFVFVFVFVVTRHGFFLTWGRSPASPENRLSCCASSRCASRPCRASILAQVKG